MYKIFTAVYEKTAGKEKELDKVRKYFVVTELLKQLGKKCDEK